MNKGTRQRKHTTTIMKALRGQDWLVDHLSHILQEGKQGRDRFLQELGGMLAETMMELDREEQAGPDYQPKIPGVYIWAAQPGSVFIGDQKVPVMRPRLRGPDGERALPTYAKLKERQAFSEELLGRALRGPVGPEV